VTAEQAESKVPEVTLVFWIIKIAATTLGETGGDTVTMTLNWGYLVGTALFLSLLVLFVIWQIAAKKFHPWLYWATIVASTTAGTTMADFFDRSLGIGYTGGSLTLFALVMASLAAWYWSEGTVSVNTVNSPRVEAFYWITITFSQTLGTALGDWRHFRLCRRAGADRGGLLLHQAQPCAAVLGGLHSDPAFGRNGGRFSGQAGRRRRHEYQPAHGVLDHRGLHHHLHPCLSPAGGLTFRHGRSLGSRRHSCGDTLGF
jgi:hypothetical protein